MTNANARQLRWASYLFLSGCLLLLATPALGQRFAPDNGGEGNGGVSLGVLAGFGLNDADSEESGRYFAADVRLVRPLGDVLGGDRNGQGGFGYTETAALRRRAPDTDGLGVGAGATLGVEDRDIFPEGSDLGKAGKVGSASQVQRDGFLDRGGTLFAVVDLLLVFPVTENVQLIPFAGAGPFRTIESDSPDEGQYTLEKRWGLVFDYGLEVAFGLGPADLRVQYRGFRFQIDEVGYIVNGESFSVESDPINTSALFVGLGINF